VASPAADRLSAAHRRELGAISAAVSSGVFSLALGADPFSIDLWFSSAADGLITKVMSGHGQARRSTMDYLTGHGTLSGHAVRPVPASLDMAQVRTSLRVTGPVAFKTAIRGGASPERAVETMARQLSGSSSRLALAGDRDTFDATLRSPRGGIIGYRRRLGGRGCGFCSMLASRGAVYLSRASASRTKDGQRYHDHCRCSPEPLYVHEDEPTEVRVLQRQWQRVTAGHSGNGAVRAWEKHWESRLPAGEVRAAANLTRAPSRVAASTPGTPTGPAAPQFPVELRPALARARSIRKVEQAFQREVKRLTGRDIPVDFHGQAVDIAADHAEGMLRVLTEFPDTPLSEIQTGIAARKVYAQAWVEAGRVDFDVRMAGHSSLYRATMRRDAANGFHMRGASTPAGTGAHELAHVVHHHYDSLDLNRKVSRLLDDLSAEAGLDVASYVQRELGGYALKHIDEMIAEAVSDALMSGAAASRLSREVLDLLRQNYRAGRRVSEATTKALASEALDLSKLTVPQLKALAKARGITIPAGARKPDIVRLLDEPLAPATSLADFDARLAAAATRADAMKAAPVKFTGGDFDDRITGLPARVTPEARAEIVQSLGIYQSANDKAINEFLRGVDLDTIRARHGVTAAEGVQAQVRGIDAAMEHSALRSDVVLWRSPGSGIDLFGPRRSWGDDLAGRTFTDPAFSSTSARHEIADRFTVNNGVRFQILAPKGTPGVRLRDGSIDEFEVLLGRSMEYRVVRDKGWVELTNPKTGKVVKVRDLDVEIVPARATPARALEAPDLEDAARARQAVVDVHRGVADTLSEVAGLLDNEASARLLTSRAEAILARSTGEVKKALAPLVRAMKTGDSVKIERAMTAAGRKLGLRRGSPAGEIVDYDRSVHGPIAGERIADGAKVRIVRPGYDATINGEDLRLSKAVVEPLSEAEVKDIERRALRAAARERNKFIESKAGTARLLAEVDELIVKGADKAAIAQRLDPALIGPEQPFAGADPAILEALRKALDTSPAALRSAVTRATTKAKLKPVSKAGAKAKFDPDTMEPVSGVDIPAGSPVTVVTRGTSVTLPDGAVLHLSKARVTVAPTKPVRTARPSRSAETADDIMDRVRAIDPSLGQAQRAAAIDEVVARVAQVFDGDFAGVTVRFNPGDIGVSDRTLQISGDLVAGGRVVGRFSRSISRDANGNLSAWHGHLEISRSRQGSGIAEEFNQNLFDWYRRSGVKRVELAANIDVGGYAWATKGFDFADPTAAQWFINAGLRKIRLTIQVGGKLPRGVTRQQLDDLNQYLRDIEAGRIKVRAFDISQWGRKPGQRGRAAMWPGKWLMLGSDWQGTLVL